MEEQELRDQVNGAADDLNCELQDGKPCWTCLNDARARLSGAKALLEPQVVEGETCPYPGSKVKGVTF
jgi:hypothetical protein